MDTEKSGIMSREKAIKFIKDQYRIADEAGKRRMGRPTLIIKTGWTEGQMCALIKEVNQGKIQSIKPGKISPQSKFRRAMSADDFIKQFDIPTKILEAIKELGERVIADGDFRNELGVQVALWSRTRDKEELLKFQVQIRGKIYWALPEVIERIRETMDVI